MKDTIPEGEEVEKTSSKPWGEASADPALMTDKDPVETSGEDPDGPAETLKTDVEEAQTDAADAPVSEGNDNKTPDQDPATPELDAEKSIEKVEDDTADTPSDGAKVSEKTETDIDHDDLKEDALAARAGEETTDTDRSVEADDGARPAHPPAVVPPPPPQKASFWPAVFGGVVAAMIGFIAGRGELLDGFFPPADPPPQVDLTPLSEATAALTERLAVLEQREPPTPPAAPASEPTPIPDALLDLPDAVAEIDTTLAEITARLDAVEARPTPETPGLPQDNSAEISALQSAVDTLQTRLAEADARASAEAERLLARAALTRVLTAVESGESFGPALTDLEEVAPVEVPEALRTAAADGVPSLNALREDFPDAARAALNAARSEVPEGETAGLGGFLRRQLGARSVTPREGSDPDAILSRAEAAVQQGDLDTALTELQALPDPARAAMQGWLDGATARKEASDAARALSDSLTVN
ncbi:mitofilin family membrane protein [uncultured Roseobacter sp.]|uniref:mitofilin family membrane protein n=1 Tax=uncultured Roseobacter sp. TaxID=114847 RepID=UPI00260A2DF8|nr:mitofilin family membrane protein [uncultured Roseobacter sp.]